ncbi:MULTISPECIES: class I SAM-dependent methyltransferase [Flammeovirga]|uniref:Class I SAM-dependent methyltransferase n=1 Tax=Flammeovirga agarivorans TaxID=2726742 RepID=A0A7X8XV66_9BACT|nr:MULTISPECIES: class I SAM-dependent methyltransferase [Flammeovirga]NLR91023.1 class I SAM-dependent methyltransferase [Flammeovirga agarivorans]
MKEGNVAFYQKMPLDIFKGFADQIGLAGGEDLQQVYATIQEDAVIMELGSGYGRIINSLKANNFKGKIIAVEIVDTLVDILKQNSSDDIQVVQADVCALDWEEESVDIILWMWSGILELSADDQKLAIEKAYKWLKKGGRMIIECPYNDSISKVGMLSNDKKIVVEEEWGVLNATLVEEQDVAFYSSKAGFKEYSLDTYETTTQLTRAIYTLIK